MTQKVAYLVSRFPHLPETFILREMNALQRCGVQVELFPLVVQEQAVIHPETKVWLEKLHSIKPYSGRCLGTNLRVLFCRPGRYLATFFQMIWFNLPSPKFLARSFYIFPWAVQAAEEMRALGVSHIHAHYATHPALAAWIISRFTDIPYSISVHAHDIYVDRTMLGPKLQRAAFIRAISEFNKRFLMEKLGAWVAEKTYVVHCGIQTDCYQSKKKKHADFKIISVGSLQEYKGHEYLIKACAILKAQGVPYNCVIAGGGDLYRSLNDLIEKMALSEQVRLLGPQTEEAVTKLLGESDCFILPSIITRTGKMEGIPVVLMEALASRLPVIASDISGVPEIIEDKKSGLLCPPGEPQAIAQKILWVRDHPGEAANMAERGYQKVVNDFNLEKCVLELKNLFSISMNK